MNTSRAITHEKESHHGAKNGPPEPFCWALTDHCCRACFARVLVRRGDDGGKVYRCSGCGVEREGRSEAVICACGMKLKTGADAGVRCVVAESPTPEFPAQITAVAG